MHGTILCHKCYDRSLPLLGSFHLSELASQISQSINAMRQCFWTESRFWPNWLCSSVINNLVMRCPLRPIWPASSDQKWGSPRDVREHIWWWGKVIMRYVRQGTNKNKLWEHQAILECNRDCCPPLPYFGRLSVERSLNHSSLQRCDTPKLNASLHYLELTNWHPRSSTQFELVYHFMHSWIAGESIFYMISGRISPILCRLQGVFRVDN